MLQFARSRAPFLAAALLQASTRRANIGKTDSETGESVMKDRAHDDAMAEIFRKDPAYAVELLNSILEDGDQGELLIALCQMAKAFGGMSKAQGSGARIDRALSAKGHPEIHSLSAILKTMGLRLAVQPIQHPARRA
ncbi:MAG: DNA-binding protein [Ottowia sp.]